MSTILSNQIKIYINRSTLKDRLIVATGVILFVTLLFLLLCWPLSHWNNQLIVEKKQLTMEVAKNNVFVNQAKQAVYSLDLVTANQITPLLNLLLSQTQGLKLLNVEILPVKKEGDFYIHGIKIIFSGNYEALLHYLFLIENQTYQLYFQHIQYRVTEYPLGQITLELATLSREKAWLNTQDAKRVANDVKK